MSGDELAALADCVGILLDDIRRQKETRSTALLVEGSAIDRAGDEPARQAEPVVSGSVPHDDRD